MSPLLAAAAAAAAAWLATGASPSSRLTPRRDPSTRATLSPSAGSLAAVGAAVGVWTVGGVVGLTVGAGIGALVFRWWRQRRDERRAAAVRDALPDVLRLLAAELHAGASPYDALSAAALTAPADLRRHLEQVAAAARLGLPPEETLLPGPAGAGALAALAVCWRVSAAAGAGLADGVARLAAGLFAEARCRAEVEAQLAGPRATAAVLAVLPAVAVLMGAGLGADPMAFFRTPPGVACLVGGLVLDAAGVAWTRRIASGASP